MRGLVSYGDDLSDSEPETQNHGPSKINDKSLKSGSIASSDVRRQGKSQIIIRKPTASTKAHARHRTSTESLKPEIPLSEPSTSAVVDPPIHAPTGVDELADIRALLRPPQIPGLDDWGIPPESTEPCNPAIETKLAQFHSLKRDPSNPKHFNDSLMSNRSFRNPHLYAKLVEFVDVDERSTNFPKDMWDPDNMQDEWFADKIAEFQKTRSEQQTASSTKRSRIEFSSSGPPAKLQERDKTATVLGGGKRNRTHVGGEGRYGQEYTSSSHNKSSARWK